jgi:ATP-binding cassette subfamily C protein
VAAHRTFSTTRTLFELASWIAVVAFLYVAVTWAALPTAQLVLIVYVFTRLMPRLIAIQTAWQRLLHFQHAFGAVAQLKAQLDASREPEVDANRAPPLVLQRDIRLEQVTFSYEADASRAALNGIDLVIPARKMTALVGPSGSGKSTVADLLLGLLTPTTGQLRVDGAPLEGARLQAWREAIGYVPQEPFLFHDTVRANLQWAKADATDAELRAALRTAAAEDFVQRLPQGLDTIVGDRGVRLSGGERQRLTLARALLRHPTLLLLDEATSALDSENERLVQSAIDRLHGELTIVVIAHRLSTVQNADQVVVLDRGRVVESGGPKELIARESGTFRRLMESSYREKP